ncbi:MAG: hypothetical protein ACJ75T_04950 [Solirubrobacterales bacterium]
MLPGNRMAGLRRAIRATVALIAVSASLGVAVSLARSGGGGEGEVGLESSVPVALPKGGSTGPSGEAPPARPLFIETPEAVSVLSETQFRFHLPPKPDQSRPGSTTAPTTPVSAPPKPRRRFQCRYDGGEWSGCGSPLRLGAVPAGGHEISIHALTRSGRAGAVASFSWRQVEPKPIAIDAADPVEALFPGFPPQPLSVTVSNPNDVPVEVTRLSVEIADDPPDCPAENFRLTPSKLSPSSPLSVPAGGSVTLPSAAAPAIEMLNLAVNQDACSEARVDLAFEGEAHG